MLTVQFVGRVLPAEAIRVSIVPPALQWESPETALVATFHLRIKDSMVQIDCETNSAGPDDIAPLYIRAFDIARASVDLISFATGTGLSVIIDAYVDQNGLRSPMVPQDLRLKGLCTAYSLSDVGSFDEIWKIVVTTPALFMALNDLISGIVYPHYGPRIAGQVTETIRMLTAPPGLEPKQQWPEMREALRVEESYLKFITDHATGPRHGDRAYIPPHIAGELARRAWTLMNRFLEFRIRGNLPLPISEFPVLA